ncbi:hypothetical protein CSHISOI_03409 [Colletotrichum shisoi]|uniref:Uncharacterized protein n=1 Tax=Colletotrichum shisoi TaxID=2078593 RepID=A0A5Q4BYA6_9PEZI|nr:hypothetical protein CSHISOI_03409 [Colletotrichum shisoi]
MGSHQKSSSSKGSSSHGKSSSSKSKSGSKRAPIYVNDACRYGPLNPYTDAHCANCGHQRCYDCTTTVIEQNPGQ